MDSNPTEAKFPPPVVVGDSLPEEKKERIYRFCMDVLVCVCLGENVCVSVHNLFHNVRDYCIFNDSGIAIDHDKISKM